MRKKGENSVKCAGKSAIPPDENNDFTIGVESQSVPLSDFASPSRLFCDGRSCCSNDSSRLRALGIPVFAKGQWGVPLAMTRMHPELTGIGNW
jgi:hypothetical protein